MEEVGKVFIIENVGNVSSVLKPELKFEVL
jgi:hypothetical protein